MSTRLTKSVLIISYVFALLCALVQPAFAEAPHSSFRGLNWSAPDPTSTVTPKWSVAIDVPQFLDDVNTGTMATGEGKVFVFQNGRLAALSATTGKKLWTYGSKLTSLILYDDGVVYAVSQDGTLHAVSAANGKKKWATAIHTNAPVVKLFVNDNKVYVHGGHIQAFDAKSGALAWTDDYQFEFMGGNIIFAGGKLIVSTELSGAYTYETLLAFDDTTGHYEWETRFVTAPIQIKENQILAQRRSSLFAQLEKTTLDTIDLSSGKVVQTFEYKENGEAWSDSQRVYIFSAGVVYAYPLDADPAKVVRDSYRSDSGYKNYWAGGPDAGRILFTDGLSVTGSKLVNKSVVYYGNVGSTGALVSRLDTFDNGLYIAYSDGRLEAKDLLTAKRAFVLQMPSRVFGPTQRESGMIIVQSQGRISAVPEPPALRRK